MYTYSLFSIVENHWEDHFHKLKIFLWYNKGKNTMFRSIKKKLETLLKHALQKDIFGICLVTYLVKRYTSIEHFGDGTT